MGIAAEKEAEYLADLARANARFTQEVVEETIPPRPTLRDEAERLLDYWERHGNNPESVAKWAVQDLLGILRYIRYITEED